MEFDLRHALAPTQSDIEALPLSSNAKIASELLAGSGERVLDIGCGEGKFTRALTKLFAQVSGVDVKASKIDEVRSAALAEGMNVDFQIGSGDSLPFGDDHFDTVIFSNSLHHMPDPRLALKEALRVLKPGGFLYVMEPVPAGNYHEATKLVNDETVVRTDAYVALMELAGISKEREMLYRASRTFAAFEDWKADQIDRDARRKARFDARPEEVESRFLNSAVHMDGKLSFDQVFRINLLRKN